MADQTSARRKRRTSQEINDRILSSARETFQVLGFGGATTAAIAARAEVSEAQLFRHFPSKAALYREAVFVPLNAHFCAFLARQTKDADKAETARERARDYIVELQDFLGDHGKMLLSLLVAEAYTPEQSPRVGEIDSLSAYFDRGAAIHASRVGALSESDPQLMVRVSFAAMLGCVLFKDLLIPQGLASEKAIQGAVTAFMLDGVSDHADSDPGG